MNFIDNIEIKNFKSIRHQKIEGCKRINVFIGYPNVGKSNILEAIGLLTFVRLKRPIGLKGLVRFEKLTQLFNNYNIHTASVIEFNKKYSLNIKYEDEKGLELRLIDHEGTDFLFNSGRLGLRVGVEQIHSSLTNGIDDFSGRLKDLQTLEVKPYKFSEIKSYKEAISALELDIPFGRNMFEVIINSTELKKEFIDLLEATGFQLLFNIAENDIQVYREIEKGSINTLPVSLIADTLIRLIFFKTAIHSNKDSILLFEEPESHMYPPYISKFTSDITCDENKNQFFITTHSPFVLNDLMANVEKDELAIYIVSYEKETGETLVHRMNDNDVQEAYQFGYDFFMNIDQFLPQKQHG